MWSLLITACCEGEGDIKSILLVMNYSKWKGIKTIDSSIRGKPYILTSHYTLVVLWQHMHTPNLSNRLSHWGALADMLHLELISAGLMRRYVIKIVVTSVKFSFSSLRVRQKQHSALRIANTHSVGARELYSSSCSKITITNITTFWRKVSDETYTFRNNVKKRSEFLHISDVI